MADRNVLQEYLLSLGFEIDEGQMKKFNSTLASTAKGTLAVGTALVGAAQAVEEFVKHIAAGMERLFYSAQLSGATVEELQALEAGAKNAGIEAGHLTAILEHMAEAFDSMPGLKAKAAALFGFDVNEQDMKKVFDRIIETVRKNMAAHKGHIDPIMLQYLGELGIDWRTAMLAAKNAAARGVGEAQQAAALREAGVPKDAAKQFTEFERHLNKLGVEFAALAERIAVDLLPIVNHWIDLLEQLVHWFNQLNKATSGKAGQIAGVVTAIGGAAAAIGLLTKAVTGLLAPLGALGSAAVGAAGLAAKGAGAGVAGLLGYEVGSAINENLVEGTKLGDLIGAVTAHAMAILGNKEAQEAVAQMDKLGTRAAPLGVSNTTTNARHATVNVHTNLNVTATGTAQDNAKAIANTQSRVNADVVRDLKGAFAPAGG